MFEIDQTAADDPPETHAGDFTEVGCFIPKDLEAERHRTKPAQQHILPAACLFPDSDVRVLVLAGERFEVWVGKVVARSKTSVVIVPWGQRDGRRFALASVVRASVVPRHTFQDFSDTCRRQREGEPARIVGAPEAPPAPEVLSVAISAELAAVVQAWGVEQGMTLEGATDRLVEVGFKRLEALATWRAKEQPKENQS